MKPVEQAYSELDTALNEAIKDRDWQAVAALLRLKFQLVRLLPTQEPVT